MINILLLILKIIGIILLCILGLILLILLAVLLVPVRYQLAGEKAEGILGGSVRITWLLRLIGIEAVYADKTPVVRVRLAGFTLKQIGGKKDSDKTESGKTKSRKTESRNIDSGKTDSVKTDSGKTDSVKTDSRKTDSEKTGSDKNAKDDGRPDKSKKSGEPADHEEIGKPGIADKLRHSAGFLNSEGKKDAAKPERQKDAVNTKETSDDTAGSGKASGLIARVNAAWNRALELLLRIPEFLFDGLQKLIDLLYAGDEAVSGLQDQIENRIQELKNRIAPFLTEASMQMYGRILGHVNYLLRHYRPRKLKGHLHLGMSAPDLTGKLTGLLYVLIPGASDTFLIEPDFENSVIETEFQIKGHVRVVHVLVVGVRLILDKQVRSTVKRLLHR